MRRPSVAVFAPAPILTVSIEVATSEAQDDEIHVHAGGQGFWVARLVAQFDVEAVLCATIGGETGKLVHGLATDAGIRVATVDVAESNGAYVHDRRSGERTPLATMRSGALDRHEIDDLYGLALTEGLAADVTVLTGPQEDDVVPDDVYRRLAADLRANGRTVVADLSGDRLAAALEGGIDVLKVSEDELEEDGRLARAGSLGRAIGELVKDGATSVVVTRGDERSVALVDGELCEIVAPHVEPVDPKGAGDSFTAATAAAMAGGAALRTALVLGAAAGAMNVTRRGLASGRRELIDALAGRVTVEPFHDDSEGRP